VCNPFLFLFPSALGAHSIKGWVTLAGDADHADDSASTSVIVAGFKPKKKLGQTTIALELTTNGNDTKPITKYLSESQSQTDTLLSIQPEESTINDLQTRKSSVSTTSKNKMHIRKQQQERQLTIMLVWLSTLYLCGQIPMLFAYPNFVFKDTSNQYINIMH